MRDFTDLVGFIVAAAALFGSPGPGIVALLAVGRSTGFLRGLPFYASMQLGLFTAVVISGFGLFSLVESIAGATLLMTVAATLYLLYLSWMIASAPASLPNDASDDRSKPAAGFVLGALNPKVYLAIISLMTAHTILPEAPVGDTLLKMGIIMAVTTVVDAGWLGLGATIGLVRIAPRLERVLNVVLGLSLAGTAVFGLVGAVAEWTPSQ